MQKKKITKKQQKHFLVIMRFPSLCTAASLPVEHASIVVKTHIEEIEIVPTETQAHL